MHEVYPEPQSISHQVEFLLQFANIHCIKKTLSCYRPEKELNRTPTKEPEVKPIPESELIALRMAYKDEGLGELEIDEKIKGYELNRSIIVDGTIYDNEAGKAVCIGNTFFNPKLFEAFCHQHGVEGVSNDQGLILWEHCQQALRAIADNNERHAWGRCIRELHNECTHREPFQLEIYRQLLQVFEMVKDSQVKIKQCPCCGRFESDKVKRGKPSVFCSKECMDYFCRPSREKDSETHIRANKVLKGGAKKEIVDYLCKNRWEAGNQITKAMAEEIHKALEQISPKTVSSLQQFLKSYHAHKSRVMSKALRHRDNKE
ncbi:hypothetical protein [Candidatus Kuenenia sp.]|uniref:hypothetical protein n=1 Tax=Candidatus Kuenenia sp. TaxID=2499824 RepID=UPI0032201C00